MTVTDYRICGTLRGTEREEIWIVDGRISHSAPAGHVRQVRGYAYPGLVDAHSHPGLSYSPNPVSDAEVIRRLDYACSFGVTTIREMGSQRDVAGLAAPGRVKVLRAGRHIARFKRYLRHIALECEPAQLPQVAADQARRGDGWIKIVGDWIDRDVGDLRPLWPGDILREAVAAAHEEGARVAVHSFATETVDDLLEAGVDSIEHGTGMTRDHLLEAAARGIIVDPTMYQYGTFADIAAQAGRFPVYRERMLGMYARMREQLALMVETGTHFVMGTDTSGEPEGRSIGMELECAVSLGMPPELAMAAASYSGRELLGLSNWQEGAPADIVVYADDPERDISLVHRPSHVFVDGIEADAGVMGTDQAGAGMRGTGEAGSR
ncbi:MAG: amidohydrolase family protein [Actinomycetaceae bacterium]|nr:amidohydrolase family protein [Actinomycetaceae bacterium]